MAQTISKTGAPVVELGTWVESAGNPVYAALMQQYSDKLSRAEQVGDPNFDAMVTAFLAATNQEIVDSPV